MQELDKNENYTNQTFEDIKRVDNNSMIIKYQNTNNVLEHICSIIDSAKNYAYQSVNML